MLQLVIQLYDFMTVRQRRRSRSPPWNLLSKQFIWRVRISIKKKFASISYPMKRSSSLTILHSTKTVSAIGKKPSICSVAWKSIWKRRRWTMKAGGEHIRLFCLILRDGKEKKGRMLPVLKIVRGGSSFVKNIICYFCFQISSFIRDVPWHLWVYEKRYAPIFPFPIVCFESWISL